MLNKKKVLIVALIILVIAVIVVTIVVSNKNKTSKVSNLYNSLSSSNNYLFEMKDTNNYDIKIAKKDGQTSIDMDSDGNRVTTLTKGDKTYLIKHADKEYYVYDTDVNNETVVTDMLKELEGANYTKGKEKINGKSYKYEEYTGFAGFKTSTNIDSNDDNVKTRFYFEKNDLKYVKTILENGDEELLEINVSYDVPDELFQIPSDYAESSF